jgi:hypothetical protein
MAMQALAGLPDLHSLVGCCWSHSAVLSNLCLPRRRHHEDHHNKTPMEVFTGQKPEWKHYDGYVMGMICWGYLFRTQTPQLGAKARHDRWGIISTAWSHLLHILLGSTLTPGGPPSAHCNL